jgi:uncharacterized protein YbjT (DUF2867 family)
MPNQTGGILCYNVKVMILVTGGTGFIGSHLVRHLLALGEDVRLLLRPSRTSPTLPSDLPLDVAVSSLDDDRGLRSALKGARVVYHLAGAERKGARADLEGVDIDGTRKVVEAAVEVGVQRLIYLSHLGADRASAYPVMKTKAMAEMLIQQSGIPYTIIRSAVAFGAGDNFTQSIKRLLQISPFFVLIPGDGKTVLQPIWVEDLAACLTNALGEESTINRIISVGGGEYFSFREIVNIIGERIGKKKRLVRLPIPYLRVLSIAFDNIFPRFPMSIFWMDYLSMDRTCALDTLPRQFGIIPARFSRKLDYLSFPTGKKKKRN